MNNSLKPLLLSLWFLSSSAYVFAVEEIDSSTDVTKPAASNADKTLDIKKNKDDIPDRKGFFSIRNLTLRLAPEEADAEAYEKPARFGYANRGTDGIRVKFMKTKLKLLVLVLT